MTALIWVQHLLGTGHLRRAQAIAAALARRGVSVVLLSGGAPLPWPAPPGVQVVQLPPVRSRDAAFSALTDLDGRPADAELWQARRRAIHEVVGTARPRIVVTEMFPFGRRAFRREVEELLFAAARFRPLVAASVRDVLVGKTEPTRWAEMRDIALARYDLVLVHSDPRVLPFDLSFPHTAALGDRLVHTGYVLGVRRPAPAGVDLAVVVSAGGGAVGSRLLATALDARRRSRLADRPWLLVGGANLPEAEHAAQLAAAPPGVSVTRHRDDLPDLLATADVSVSQAGYNTIVEGLAGAARLVLVPFDGPGQDEQQKRAGRLAELGLATVVAAEELSPETLAGVIDRAAALPRPDTGWIDLDGARRAVALLLQRADLHGASA
jgi:predicted glycosyltransferase